MKPEDLKLTQQEISLILTRRRLMASRQAIPAEPNKSNPEASQRGLARPKGFGDQPDKEPKENWDKNRPPGWDTHCNPCQIHKGRLTPKHPMYWFEENVFRKIPNKQHQAEHKKIKEILGMPVQTNSRDRVYHALCHLDVLWTENKLPVAYKHKYEEYKKKHGIGDDNIHPAHKKPGVKYPVPKNKKPWDPEQYSDYDPNEIFVA